jgi:hypothetical protein
MPIEIKIAGETPADAAAMLQEFNRAMSAPDPRTMMSLDDLVQITGERLAQAGVTMSLTAKVPVVQEAAEATVAAVQEALAQDAVELPGVEVAEEESEEVVPVKRTRKKPAEAKKEAKKPAVAQEPDPGAEADRAYVLDELTKRFNDPKQKDKTKAFIDKVSGAHGGVRLSRLDAAIFPDVRKAMEAAFGHGGNGHAGI